MDRPPVADAPPPQPPLPERPRLHYIYYVLAVFDLLTVTLSLLLMFWITSAYSRSVDENQVWAERLGVFWDLGRLAAHVAGPANDVFDPQRDVEEEAESCAVACVLLEKALASIEADLAALSGQGAPVSGLAEILEGAREAKDEMIVCATDIFDDFRAGRGDSAGARMAAMDQAYYEMNEQLADLSGLVRDIQRDQLSKQRATASSLRVYEFGIAGLIVLMVVAVTVYGHKLAQRMKSSARELSHHRHHLEALVRERTAQLESSHEQLRVAERLASIGTLAAGLGHDMNNVLFPVRCRLDALDAARLDAKVRGEIDAVRRSVRYLQQLSDGLRLLALDPDDPQAGAGGVTSLAEWWNEVAPLFRTALPRPATFQVDLPDDLPPVAVAAHALTQAVFNLVVNAGEAISPRGTVRLWAQAKSDGDRRLVRLGVSDDGPGMSAEVKRRALDPFFTTKRRGLSTGLGLALVHGVARSAGGSVEIDSLPGRGTTVTLALPAADGPSPKRPHDAGEGATDGGGGQVAAVTLADGRVSALMTAMLEAEGLDVVHERGAEGGDGALWVVDATHGRLDAARRFLAGRRGRSVIAIGPAGAAADDWRGVAVLVDGSAGLPELREAIREAVAAVQGSAR